MRLRAFYILAFLLLLFSAHDTSAQNRETRIALIIANEAYASSNLGRLPGTRRDAEVMHSALTNAGFEVTVLRNLERIPMRNALRDFARRLGALGENGVGFFYYSGHGIADDPNGVNYLMPIDAEVTSVTDLPIMGLSLSDTMQMIELAHARATVVVIDACRNMPISLGRNARGLAPVSASTDTLVAFSTQPGEVASDDGLYARVLALELSRPGSAASEVFQRVQSAVAEQTNRRQRPRYDNGIYQSLVFVPSRESPRVEPGAVTAQEAEVDIFYDQARVDQLARISVLAQYAALNAPIEVRSTPSAAGRVTGTIAPSSVFFIAGRVGAGEWYMVSARVEEGSASAFMVIGYVHLVERPPVLPGNPVIVSQPPPSTLREGRLSVLFLCNDLTFDVRSPDGRLSRSSSTMCRGPEGNALSAGRP